MAIDTAEKRRSISGIDGGIIGVTPNISQDQEWRQEVAGSYSGILASLSTGWGNIINSVSTYLKIDSVDKSNIARVNSV